MTESNSELARAARSDWHLPAFGRLNDEESRPFDPLEYGPENKEWTTIVHKMSTLKRVLLLLEHGDDATTVGNFRAYGAAQWLRESIWAMTEVFPRDPGAPNSDYFRRAETLFREGFVDAPNSTT